MGISIGLYAPPAKHHCPANHNITPNTPLETSRKQTPEIGEGAEEKEMKEEDNGYSTQLTLLSIEHCAY